MADELIRFNDGAAYERMMGGWSRIAGDIFLDWLAPTAGLRWVDVGCGNGAFTEAIVQRCAPAEIQGVDPSEGQIAFARTREAARPAVFQLGDAMALPFADGAFDAAVMALVIFFVPDPAKGVAEMVRVVAPGGLVAAYAWDMEGGGFPLHPIQAELRAMGVVPVLPPRADASRIDALQALWTGAGLQGVETRQIEVQRRFADFEDFWSSAMLGVSIATTIAAMPAADVTLLKNRVCASLGGPAGPLLLRARANAVKGRVPA
ncbi:MAG TPA: class I SAM-dependent methyltransferase [Tardiphaga sp.]